MDRFYFHPRLILFSLCVQVGDFLVDLSAQLLIQFSSEDIHGESCSLSALNLKYKGRSGTRKLSFLFPGGAFVYYLAQGRGKENYLY